MAKATSLQGVASLMKKIDKLDQKIKNDVAVILEDVADKIEHQAQLNAPDRRANMEVSIAANIGKERIRDGKAWRIEVGSQALPFAAYVEFGTGQDYKDNVAPTLPPEWQKLAFSFFVTGKGTLRHTPFLYPAFNQYTPELLKQLRLVIKNNKLK